MHWTPTFIVNRLAIRNFRKINGGEDLPCLTSSTIQFLDSYLTKQDNVFEYGSGFSTAWFAQRVGQMISVENDPYWFNLVSKKLSGFTNTQFFLIDSKQNCTPIASVSWDYVHKINDYKKESFDFILNDGFARALVAIHSIDYLKKGGILCWDDFGGSFPLKNTVIPYSMKSDKNVNEWTWQFLKKIEGWRRVIFDDGVHSTALFFKPD